MKRLLPAFVFLVLPCLLLWRVVFAGEAFVPAGLLRDVFPWRADSPGSGPPWNPLMWDGVAEFYPWRVFAARAIHTGFLPLWNPHQFCGTPFLANSQSAVLYPLNLLFYALPVPVAFGASALLHLFLTGCFQYLFLRRGPLKLSRPAATIGAMAWQISAWQVSWLALPTFLCVSAWLPLALWLTHRAVERSTYGRAAALGACLGLMLLAGHLQIALYCLLLVGAFALFRARAFPGRWRRFLGLSLLALALAFGLAAPQLLPAVELSRFSHRAGGLPSWGGYASYVRLAMPAWHLITLFLPSFFGNPSHGTYWGWTNYAENACSVGLLPLLLMFLGIGLTWKRASNTRFFALAALAALLLALGTPLDALLFFGVPGFAQSGSPARVLVLWTFSAATLAGIGAEAMLKAALPIKAVVKSLGTLAAVFVSSMAVTLTSIARQTSWTKLLETLRGEGDLWRLPTGLLLGMAALLWLRQRGTVGRTLFAGLLVALVVVDLLATNFGYSQTAPVRDIYPVTPGIAFLQQNANYERVMPINAKWSLYQSPDAVLPPNAATVYGLYDTQGYDSLLTGRYIRFAAAMNGGPPTPQENGNMVFTNGYGSAKAQEAAARFVVSTRHLTGNGLTLRAQEPGMLVYEAQAQPRVRVVEGEGDAAITALSPTRMTVQIRHPSRNGVLVVADQWYPGWKAWVNGRWAEIEARPDVFRSVSWQGETGPALEVQMRYEPFSFRIGLYVMGLALMFLTAAAIRGSRQRLRRDRRGG